MHTRKLSLKKLFIHEYIIKLIKLEGTQFLVISVQVENFSVMNESEFIYYLLRVKIVSMTYSNNTGFVC